MSELDRASERIINGDCWDDFCDALKQVGRDVVLAETAPGVSTDVKITGWTRLALVSKRC